MTFALSSRLKHRSLAVAALAATVSAGVPAHAELIIGLTSTNALLTFDSASPTNSSTPVTITGLNAFNETIVGIDLRPATGAIYALSNAGRLYTLNSTTGVATFASTISGATLTGGAYGVDFNPTVDRLRITSTSGQNLRVNVTTGVATVDAAINGATTSVAGSAYTNNFAGATTTTLYDISAATDTLYTQAPPNSGTLVPVGSLGLDTTGVSGFDISGVTGVAYASLTNGDTGDSGIYTINLGTGAATFAGTFGIGGNTAIAPPLLGLTVAAIPEPQTYALLLAGLGAVGFMARRRSRV